MKKSLILALIFACLVICYATFSDAVQLGRFGGSSPLQTTTVASLPASPATNTLYIVTDGNVAGDCTVGGGTTRVICVYNGAAWVAAGDGVGGAGSGSVTTIQVGGVQVGDADIVTIDFNSGVTVVESPNTKVTVSMALTPSSGNATLVWDEGALQVKYDGGVMTESSDGLTLDLTPSSGSATLISTEDALQVKYYTTHFTEGMDGLMLATSGVTNALVADAAAIAWSKMAALTSAHILVGSAANVATDVAVSGDVTMANTGAVAIGNDKITEAMLKAVDAASDEDILTYESTTGDFEWHTAAQVLENISSTQGGILYRSGSAWTALASGTSDYVLLTGGAGANPVWGQVNATGLANNVVTATHLSATLTFGSTDSVDISGVTVTAGQDYGFAIPRWADVVPTTDTAWMAWDYTNNILKVYDGGWVSISPSGAPTDAKYWTSSADATLSAEVNLGLLTTGLVYSSVAAATSTPSIVTEGLAIDLTSSSIAFDPTELTGNRTWAAGGAATIAWTWDVSTGTDPVITFGNNYVNISTGALQVAGNAVYNASGTDVAVADGGTNKSSWTQYAIPYLTDTTTFGEIAVGTAGQYLIVNSGATGYQFTAALTMDTITDGSSYQKVAAADVDGSGHVNKLIVPEGGTVSFAGPGDARVLTVDDAAQELAARNRTNTFTGNNTFGDGDTDTFTVRSLVVGGNSRAVWIAGSAPTPTYATGTNELYVAGDIETPGTVYAASFYMADGADGTRGITLSSNTALTPTVDQIYFINDVLYFSQAGVQKTPMRLEDTQTATGKKTFQADIAVGDASNAGTIDIYDGSSNYWTISVPALSSNYELVLPSDAGVTGKYLKVTTVGSTATLSFDTPTASADTTGGTGGVQFNAAGVLTSDAGFVFTTASDKLSLGESGGSTTGTLDLYYTGTAYAATLTPNASMAGDVTITMPSYTTTLLGTGVNTFTGAQTVSYVNSNASADLLTIGGAAITENGNDVYRGIVFTPGAVTASSTGNTITGVAIGNLGTHTNATGYGITIGTGWDQSIHLPNTGTIYARKAVDDGDIPVFTISSHDDLTIGDEAGTLSGVTVWPSMRFKNSIIAGGLIPATADTVNLGSESYEWANLYLGDGAVVYFQNDQSVYITAATGKLTLTGSIATTSGVTVGTTLFPDENDGAALGASGVAWSDLFLASGAVINFNASDVTITHGANVLTLGGGDLALGANNLTMTGSLAATGARATKGWFTDLEVTNDITISGVTLAATYQPLDADLTTWAGVTPGTGVATALAIQVNTAGGVLTSAATVDNLTDSTSASIGIGTIELGHASDTTIARSAAGVITVEGIKIPRVIASGTTEIDFASIASGATEVISVSATNVTSADVVEWNPNGDISGVTGYAASTDGGLHIWVYPATNYVKFMAFNNTAGAINAGAINVNWMVLRRD